MTDLLPASAEIALLDACCLINLYATRIIERVLGAVPYQFAIVDIVTGESLFVRRGGTGDDAGERDAIPLHALLSQGVLREVTSSSPQEVSLFVQLAAQVDDGEAMTCAIAIRRGHAVATDDRKTLRVLRQHHPEVQILTTASIIKSWTDAEQPSSNEIAAVLRAIRERARFMPSRDDPLHAWWSAFL